MSALLRQRLGEEMKVIIPDFVTVRVVVEPDKYSFDVKTYHDIRISFDLLRHAPEQVDDFITEYAMRGHRKVNDKEVSDGKE